MIPEIALFCLIVTCFCAFLGMLLPIIGAVRNNNHLISYAWPLSYASFIFASSSIVLLAYSFTVDDFSVMYIAQHSNTNLPYFFKIAAVWGGHEGSLLFWVFSLATWSAAIAFVNRNRNKIFISRVLIVMSFLTLAFALLTLLASSPFERIFPVPLQGRDLNPMLQDIGLIFHPPLLYLGYVGFSGAFAFAVAALTMPDLNIDWAKWSRSWTLIAWVMLTGGIALGAWWAYYELGWGGWWFWDPVENASLLPWLTGTALLHSLIASEKTKSLMNWSLLLSIFTFCLSLLGTFVVRSGVLTSVHAFAVDPTRGVLLLCILAICLIVPLTLFVARSGSIIVPRLQSLYSREVLFLVINSLFAVITLTVLLGTFYPMLFQLFGLGQISVGAPYFNAVFVPLALLVMLVMGGSPYIHWKKTKITTTKVIKNKLFQQTIAAFTLSAIAYLFMDQRATLFVFVVLFIISWLLVSLFFHRLSLKSLAMTVAHFGVVILSVGILMVSYFSTEVSEKMGPGVTVQLDDLTIHYHQTQWRVAANFTAQQAKLEVIDANNKSIMLTPERRHYPVRVMNMSEPAIKGQWFRDIYITMGEKIGKDSYAIRIQNRAFIAWLWLGSILMMLGGVLAIVNRVFANLNNRKLQNSE
ncbi:MAG: heme lyase CcmF/NrfE family subunit [Psychromonas sp.]